MDLFSTMSMSLERLRGLGREEKDRTEEEGIFVAGGRANIEGNLRVPRGPKKIRRKEEKSAKKRVKKK